MTANNQTKSNIFFLKFIIQQTKINEKTKKEPNGPARWTLLKKSSGMRVSHAWIFMVCIFKRMMTCYLPKKIIISLPGGSLAWPPHGSYDERIFFYPRMRYISVSTEQLKRFFFFKILTLITLVH